MTEAPDAGPPPGLVTLRRRIGLTFMVTWFLALGMLLAVALREGHARRLEQLDTELALRATVIYGLAWIEPDGPVHHELLDQEPWSRDDAFALRVLRPDATGEFRVDYGPALEDPALLELRPALSQILTGELERWQGDVAGLRAYALPMFADDSLRVYGIALTTHDRSPLLRELFGYSGSLVGAFVLLAALGVFVSRRLAVMSVRPLEEVLRSRTRFIARAAHELRTPLATLQTVAASASSGDEPAVRGLQRVADITEQASRRVETLLWHARLSSGDDQLRREATRVDLLAETVLDDYPKAELHAEPVTAKIDVTLVELALRNLLENARRHAGAPEGEGVTVHVEPGTIEVCDRGPGFPPDFELRVGGTRSNAASGVGLGLDIARCVAQLHGGTVTIRSNDPGSRIGLTFDDG